MLVTNDTEFRGRKQAVGSPLLSASGRIHFFVGYCDNCRGKCMVTPDEAKKLMRMFYRRQHRPVQRMVVRILRKYADI